MRTPTIPTQHHNSAINATATPAACMGSPRMIPSTNTIGANIATRTAT